MGLRKLSKYFNIFLMTLLVVEYIILVYVVDLIPFILCGVICGIFILINNKKDETEEGFSTVTIQKGEEISIVSYLILSVIVILIAIVFFIRGMPILWETLKYLLNTSRIFRYVIYGFLMPIISTVFITYCYTETNPFEQLFVDVFFVTLLISLFAGIIICMNWDAYFVFAQSFVNIF